MTRKEVEQVGHEIDLFDFAVSLWKEKVLIFAITAVITFIGLGYILLTPPTYETGVKISPPSISDIVELQKFDNLNFSQKQIFIEFLSILNSNQLREKFLQEEGVMNSLFDEETTKREALVKLEKIISVQIPKRILVINAIEELSNLDKDLTVQLPKNTLTNINAQQISRVSINLQSGDAEQVAKFANKFVDLAIGFYRTNISLAFDSEIDMKIKQLNDKKSRLIAIYEGRLGQEIAKLKDAFLIAKELDIIEPRESKDRTVKTESFPSSITEEMRYLYSQGTRALNAEIEILTNRKQNHSMVEDLIDIEQELSLLNAVSFDASKVKPVKIDLPARTPKSHIKPKSLSIVLLSVLIGVFLAITFVLIRNAVRNRKA